jgi:hypothetical protein
VREIGMGKTFRFVHELIVSDPIYS